MYGTNAMQKYQEAKTKLENSELLVEQVEKLPLKIDCGYEYTNERIETATEKGREGAMVVTVRIQITGTRIRGYDDAKLLSEVVYAGIRGTGNDILAKGIKSLGEQVDACKKMAREEAQRELGLP